MTAAAPDYPDFTQPVALTEQVSGQLIPGGQMTANVSSPVLDTSGAASLVLTITAPNAVAGELYVLTVNWLEGNTSAGFETLSYVSAPTYSRGTPTITWQLPVRGSQANIFIIGSTNDVTDVTAYLSSRSLLNARVTSSQNDPGRALIDMASGPVNPGVDTARIHLPPVETAVLINPVNTSSSVVVFVEGVAAPDGVLQLTTMGTWQTVPAAGGIQQSNFVVPAPGIGLAVHAHNFATTAQNFGFTAWDIS